MSRVRPPSPAPDSLYSQPALRRWTFSGGNANVWAEARYPSGKGEVCKTFMRRFDSDPRLQNLPAQLDYSENRDEVVFFLIELAVDRTQHVFNLAPRHISRDAPTERQLIALATADVPLFHHTVQAPDGGIGFLLAGIWHHYKKFVAALTEDNVTSAKAGRQKTRKFP